MSGWGVRAPFPSSAGDPSPVSTGVHLLGPTLAGTAATAVVVVAGGRAPLPVGVQLPDAFWGLLSPAVGGGTLSAVLVLLGLAGLLISWWTVLQAVRSSTVRLRVLLVVALAWTAPVLLAPPMLSLDGYAYLAQGRMLASGVDPYLGGPVLLVEHDEAARVDPMWRASPVPYGPVALALLRAVAVVTQDLTFGVLLLRLLAITGVVVATAGVLAMTGLPRRPLVFALTALNPITIVHLVGGVHLDAVLAGLVVSSLLLAWRGRWTLSALTAAAAVGLKASSAPLLLLVVLAARRAGTSWTRLVLHVLSSVLVLGALATPLVGRPWGFLPALLVPGAAASWYSPSTWLATLLGVVTSVLGLGAGTGQAAGRLAVLLAGGVLVLGAARGALTRRPVLVRSTSAALLVASLSLPAVYGWYLAAGMFGLAAFAVGAEVRLLVLLCSALLFSSLPPLYDAKRWPLALVWAVVLPALVLAARRLLSGPSRPGAQVGLLARRPHLQATAAGGMFVLAVAALTGLAYAPETATSRTPAPSLAEAALGERSLVVGQLRREYPELQVARIGPGPGAADYRVLLVRPGVGTCEVLLARVVGPLAPLRRLPARDAGTMRATEALSCPPPAGAR